MAKLRKSLYLAVEITVEKADLIMKIGSALKTYEFLSLR
ncbi:hypothetical protein HNP31_000505 [Acinetobacter johnsonii]|jgi:hypothetical protein|nr:hypothetical protein [Acinetobacter johnsonii]